MKIDVPGHPDSLRPGKLLCIGRNYVKHADEMGGDVPDEPMVFLKPSTALVRSGGAVVLPPPSEEVHHEVELVAAIGTDGKHIAEEEALDHVAGYAAGLDMTARDLQRAAKQRRHPWSVAKGFDTFAPLGPIVPAADAPDVQDAAIRLSVNGEMSRGCPRWRWTCGGEGELPEVLAKHRYGALEARLAHVAV
ncbi:MAG: hypothetical protein BRD38_03810 [Bacteroidetes bacterium QH_9_67_14]|nr:MAG: hypothetical protein BRD38_03810 [Bacteroidetes bacterium QH_9_67_14]